MVNRALSTFAARRLLRKAGCYADRHRNRQQGANASKLVRALRDSTLTLPSAVRRISLSMS